MRIAVLGLGRVGLVNAACLASNGHVVRGVDTDRATLSALQAGTLLMHEAGLSDLVRQQAREGRLHFTAAASEAVEASEISLICVGTPGRASGVTDLSQVEAAGADIGAALAHGDRPHTVVLRSTVPPGTTDLFAASMARRASRTLGSDLHVAVQPEFLREGTALTDMLAPPYTLVGADDPVAAAVLAELWAFVEAPFRLVGTREAELVKLASNAFHAAKVAFANEVGRVSQSLGADGRTVMALLAQDHVLNASPAYLQPGLPYGGPCLPKDLGSLLAAARSERIETPLLESVPRSNQLQLDRAYRIILEAEARKPGPIGFLGLAFKAGTGDLRGSPTGILASRLAEKGRQVLLFDDQLIPERRLAVHPHPADGAVLPFGPAFARDLRDLLLRSRVLIVSNHYATLAGALPRKHPHLDILDLDQELAAARTQGSEIGVAIGGGR